MTFHFRTFASFSLYIKMYSRRSQMRIFSHQRYILQKRKNVLTFIDSGKQVTSGSTCPTQLHTKTILTFQCVAATTGRPLLLL